MMAQLEQVLVYGAAFVLGLGLFKQSMIVL